MKKIIRATTAAVGAIALWLPGIAAESPATVEAVLVEDGPVRGPLGRVRVDPYDLISEDTLFGALEDLTNIRPFAGWRNSASSGEAEAVAYLVDRLEQMHFLAAWGLELERQVFHTYSGTEFRETRVFLTVAGVETEVPAFGVTGHRDNLPRNMLFDSDGQVNDSDPDPVSVSGAARVVLWEDDVFSLPSLSGEVVLLDYQLIDRVLLGNDVAIAHAEEILAGDPAAIVPFTRYSNVNGGSHGTFCGDVPVWVYLDGPLPPILNLRLEDLEALGISDRSQLELVESARVIWDMDVFAPGNSVNLAARIPGVDGSQAVILGAHIDSPNSPGAGDDGSGSVVLLQVAAALDAAHMRPPVDIHLVWFGSEERGLYGSSVYANRHSELLERTLAMLQIDALSVPLDGIDPFLNMASWTYARHGNTRLACPEYFVQLASDIGVYTDAFPYFGAGSDHANFIAWDVPNAGLGYTDPNDPTQVHYASHWHDPYDTADLLRSESAAFVDMAALTLAVALETGREQPVLRVTPPADRRALFVASHTESTHMTPSQLIDLGMTLAWHGFDVDTVPHGQEVRAEDLEDTDLVVVLPVHDYPDAEGEVDLYDEEWTAAEVDALEVYARGGGLLMITNSAHRLKAFNRVYEANEDAIDMNTLAGRFNVDFGPGLLSSDHAAVTSSHPLVDGVTELAMAHDNGVPFTFTGGQVLARIGSQPVVYVRPAAAGEIIVIADLGILGDYDGSVVNLPFFENLATYARTR